MSTYRDIDAIATWSRHDPDGPISRNTGPRREPDAACYECGGDCEDGPTLDTHQFCDRACLDAWVRR